MTYSARPVGPHNWWPHGPATLPAAGAGSLTRPALLAAGAGFRFTLALAALAAAFLTVSHGSIS